MRCFVFLCESLSINRTFCIYSMKEKDFFLKKKFEWGRETLLFHPCSWSYYPCLNKWKVETWLNSVQFPVLYSFGMLNLRVPAGYIWVKKQSMHFTLVYEPVLSCQVWQKRVERFSPTGLWIISNLLLITHIPRSICNHSHLGAQLPYLPISSCQNQPCRKNFIHKT